MSGTERGYTLFDTPLDKHATNEERVRIYEFVRININRIVPFLRQGVEIDLLASGTPHNQGLVPLLGFHFGPSKHDFNVELIQRTIDDWFVSQDPDLLDRQLEAIVFPTWEHLRSVRRYPQRD